jgi:type II secretory pathway pseudopilin PulG
MRNQNGITVLETLMAVTIFGILLATFPLYFDYQETTTVSTALESSTQALRRAQVLSQAVDGDQTWGVYFQSESITLFQGSSYAARDSSFDETQSISDKVTFSGLTEVVFDKLTGEPQSTGTLTLTTTNETRTLTVNALGALSY